MLHQKLVKAPSELTLTCYVTCQDVTKTVTLDLKCNGSITYSGVYDNALFDLSGLYLVFSLKEDTPIEVNGKEGIDPMTWYS